MVLQSTYDETSPDTLADHLDVPADWTVTWRPDDMADSLFDIARFETPDGRVRIHAVDGIRGDTDTLHQLILLVNPHADAAPPELTDAHNDYSLVLWRDNISVTRAQQTIDDWVNWYETDPDQLLAAGDSESDT